MTKHTLPSGAQLDITLLPYEEAWGVCQVVSSVVDKLKIDLGSMRGVEVKDLLATDIMSLKGPICAVIGSKEIVDAAKTCFKRCTYNGVRIDAMTFEKAECRGDFIPVVFYAIKENIAPFFVNLLSFLGKN